jgi:hypothetical protein
MASSVIDLSDTMRGQSPEELLETASDYVRQNPALVFSAAAACGFALARLLRGGAGRALLKTFCEPLMLVGLAARVTV